MIDEGLLKEIKVYTDRHYEKSRDRYEARSQLPDSIYENIYRGKVGEWCCYLSMVDAGYILKNEPDMKVDCHKNIYDTDLICIGKNKTIYDEPRNIHVKTVSLDSYTRWGGSFLVQK